MIKIGIIGMSEGNGHPYSWSAIFNGYDKIEMNQCQFSAIPEYLSKQSFPEDFLNNLAQVTHIWTQDINLSHQIARASKIGKVVENYEDMIGEVDAVLLARDDAQYHYEIAKPFLKAGLPIFIDKPFSLLLDDAKMMLKEQMYDSQIFTCSSLRYANELIISEHEKISIGDIYHVEASVMKNWNTYAIHLLEPILINLPHRGDLQEVIKLKNLNMHHTSIRWENASVSLKITGNNNVPLEFTYYGSKSIIRKSFSDSFACFKASLNEFILQIQTGENRISRNETMELVELIEKGR